MRGRIKNENDTENKKESWRKTEKMRVGLKMGLKTRE